MPEFFGVMIDKAKAMEYKKAFTVRGISCSYDLVSFGEKVYQGYEAPQGIAKEKVFCEACHDIYTQENAKLVNYNANRGLDQAGEPIKRKGEYLNMRHENFKDYAADAKKVYDTAIVSYRDIVEQWRQAQEKWKDAQQERLSEYDAAISKAAYMQAEQDYKNNMQALQDGTQKHIVDIRSEMETHVNEFYRADPSKLDMNTLRLLDSGILNDQELITLASANRSNVTMLRMIASNMADKCKTARGAKEHGSLLMISKQLASLETGGKELEWFDNVTAWGDRCLDSDTYFADVNSKHFDRIYNQIAGEFDNAFAQPESGEGNNHEE